MQDRPLRSRPQVATALAAIQAVAERVTRVAGVRAKSAEVTQLATAHLRDIMRAREELERNCSPVRAESALHERVLLLGQEWVESLRTSGEDEFDPQYLATLEGLYAELLEMLDARVEPDSTAPERREMVRLRRLMLQQKQGAGVLLLKIGKSADR